MSLPSATFSNLPWGGLKSLMGRIVKPRKWANSTNRGLIYDVSRTLGKLIVIHYLALLER